LSRPVGEIDFRGDADYILSVDARRSNHYRDDDGPGRRVVIAPSEISATFHRPVECRAVLFHPR
jgi:hypothetical protein